MRIRHLRHWPRTAATLATLAILGLASPADAQGFARSLEVGDSSQGYAKSLDFGDLYQATVIVTGTDMRQHPESLGQCLREVLVKLSGEPKLALDPRVAELAQHPEPLLVAFDHRDMMAGQRIKDDQGTTDRPHALTARFDTVKIDKVLADLGERVWRRERPTIVPVLSIRGFSGNAYLLSIDNQNAADQRTSFADRAREYGIALRIPSEADLAGWGVAPGAFPSPERGDRPDQAVVAGTLEFKEAVPGWVGEWRMRWQGVDYTWRISGVSYDEAFRDVVRGVVRLASGHGGPE
ncbi:MAG: DUF2066 domain-containing protein [Proteobacteria bacterium]|nr:DUF2066 domain-containing protein [Pseudomonadota bacterium]MBI3497415.1 DUF2066 domain-containing protein [Pseudomonadota bacterium]